jgi:hypothetical protein
MRQALAILFGVYCGVSATVIVAAFSPNGWAVVAMILGVVVGTNLVLGFNQTTLDESR